MGNSLLWHLGSWLSSCLCIWFWSLKHTKKAVGKERQINVVARKSKLDFPSMGWSPGGQFFTPVWPWRYGCPTKARALHHEAKNTHVAQQSETWKQGSSRGGVLRPHYSLTQVRSDSGSDMCEIQKGGCCAPCFQISRKNLSCSHPNQEQTGKKILGN